MLLPHAHHVFLPQRYMIAIETFVVVQCIIYVDIFYIGLQGRSRAIWVGFSHFRRVTFCTIDTFIAQQHRRFRTIKIIATIIVVIISRRVIDRREHIVFPHSQNGRIHFSSQGTHIVRICFFPFVLKHPFLLRGQSIQSHILFGASSCFISECHHRTRCSRYASPCCSFYLRSFVLRQWQTVFKTFFTIAQNIFAHIS